MTTTVILELGLLRFKKYAERLRVHACLPMKRSAEERLKRTAHSLEECDGCVKSRACLHCGVISLAASLCHSFREINKVMNGLAKLFHSVLFCFSDLRDKLLRVASLKITDVASLTTTSISRA